jgi:hypothetical protein
LNEFEFWVLHSDPLCLGYCAAELAVQHNLSLLVARRQKPLFHPPSSEVLAALPFASTADPEATLRNGYRPLWSQNLSIEPMVIWTIVNTIRAVSKVHKNHCYLVQIDVASQISQYLSNSSYFWPL